jgi:hypothetical protein
MKKAVVEQMASLITAAFGLVAALAWNGAIQAIFKHFFGDPGTLSAMIYYAVIVTIVAVIATMWVGRVLGKLK